MMKITAILLAFAVLGTVAHASSSLFDAFAADGFKFNRQVSEKSQILQFKSDTVIGVSSQDAGSKQGASYRVNIYPYAKLSEGENQYYLGWVDQYTSTEDKTVEGLNNTELKHKPVFLIGESVRSGLINSIKLPGELSKDFRNFIGSFSDQFSPTIQDPEKYKVQAGDSDATTIASEYRDSSVSDDGLLSQNIILDSENFVTQNEIRYSFTLQNINDATVGEVSSVKFEGGNLKSDVVVNTRLSLEKKADPDFALIEEVLKLLESDPTTKTFSKEEFDKLIASDFEAEIQGKARDSTVEPTTQVKRSLQTVYPIYSKTLNLISQNVLGKTLTVQLSITCSLKASGGSTNPNNTLTCSANIVLVYAGITKNIPVYSFTKQLKNWSQSASFGGQWGIGIVIPLPPPVSFIQIALSFKIGYGLSIGVSAVLVANNFTASSWVNTSVTASAEAGIRVGIAEGGVYLGGTIVSIRTEPTLTLLLLFNKINGSAVWKLKLNAFSFNWGLYYKWCYFFGCGSRKTLTSWIVTQGVSSTYTIFSKSFIIWL